jgi:F-type H+-transporting ATPase subunit b
MDMLNNFFQLTIIKSLKIDQTVILQFVLFVIFFNIIAPVLFKKIQEILDLRDAKTTKLDSSANHLFKQADDLHEQYNGKIEKTHQDAQSTATKKKNETLVSEKALLDSAEEKMTADYEVKKSTLVKEMSEKRNIVMAEAEKLSGNLLDKLTK